MGRGMDNLAFQHGTMIYFGTGDNQPDNLSHLEITAGCDESSPAANIIDGAFKVLIFAGEIDRLVIGFSRMFSHFLISLNLSRFHFLRFVFRNQSNSIAF